MIEADQRDGGRDVLPDRIPRQSFFELVPKRSLWKAALLLVLLAGIVYVQQRSALMVKRIVDVVAPPAPAPASAPRVRLAPPGNPNP